MDAILRFTRIKYTLRTPASQALNLTAMDEQELGRRIRHMREERGWTQEELAHRAGMTVVYLSGIERGKQNPSFRKLKGLAEAFSITLVALFTDNKL